MTTLRKSLEWDIEKATDALKMYDWVVEHYPALMDLEVDHIYAYGWGNIEFVQWKPGGGLASKVAEILGVDESFEKERANGYEKATHRIEDDTFKFGHVTIETRVKNEEGCKTYRVTKQYETTVCGDPPSGDTIVKVEEVA